MVIEPSGAPDPAKVDVGKVKGVPHLIVWGDFRDKVAVWQRLPIAPTKYRDALVAGGGKAEVFDLPVMGIKGNTHMLMMDRNSDDVAKLIHDWIAKQGLVNSTPTPARILSKPALRQLRSRSNLGHRLEIEYQRRPGRPFRTSGGSRTSSR